ncbi:hypothetical protein BRC83_00455 [Halobacteriales archaeon QS_1_68_17]|nr:MAG: hypothetical protein BRC83_00455 [Halobacteriales archaeon QS_1_68_17]
MGWQYTLLLILFAGSVVLNLALAGYYALHLLRRRENRVVVGALLFVTLSALVWSVAYAFQLSNTTLPGKSYWHGFVLAGSVLIAVGWLALTLALTDREEWLTRWRFGPVVAWGVVVSAGVITNGSHGLFWSSELGTNGSLLVMSPDYTPLYYAVQFSIRYGLVLIGTYLLVQLVRGPHSLYRGQAAALMFAPIVPMLANAKYVARIGPLPLVDLTPVSFTISGAAVAYAIFRYQFLDVVPVARRTVVETMRDGYVVLDDRDRIVDLNPAAERLLGLEDGDVGIPIDETFPSAALPLPGAGETLEEVVLDADGERRVLELSSSPLSESKATGRLIVLRDVTERRRVEKQYQALIENAMDLVIVMDENATITYASPAHERVLGCDPETFVGRDGLDLLVPEDRERLRAEFHRVVADPSHTSQIEFRIPDSNGSVRIFEGIGRNLLDDPFVEGIVINSREVTGRRRREEQLERTNERLEEFASVVSHDLRSPLAVARGNLELAREGDDGAFEKVERAHERMNALIDDVLALARQGQAVSDPAAIDLEAVATDAWEAVRTDGATLRVEDSRTLTADRSRFQQLLENLFRNAVDHAAPEPTVRIGVHTDGFYVADDGPGIAPDLRDRVFEHGYSTNDGTGLGLSIVARIAEAHGWSVSVAESEDGGARFEFDLKTGAEIETPVA